MPMALVLAGAIELWQVFWQGPYSYGKCSGRDHIVMASFLAGTIGLCHMPYRYGKCFDRDYVEVCATFSGRGYIVMAR